MRCRSLASDLHLKYEDELRSHNHATQLESWNDGAAKSAILDFVTKVTTANSPHFVPPAERIATFDNDGTLWLEKPLYIQLQHGLRAIGKAAAEKPELRDRQPFKAVYEKDMAWLGKAAADYAKGDPSGVFILVSGLTEVSGRHHRRGVRGGRAGLPVQRARCSFQDSRTSS